MTTQLDGIPKELASLDLEHGSVNATIDETLYPLDALYGATYIFIDRCYVLLDKPEAGKFRVVLAPKKGASDAAALRDLLGEFLNELVACAWRSQITKENRALIESVTMQAIGGAMGPPSLDDLASFDFTEEPFEDPLGIAMSWEEKYKKKDGKPEASAAAAPAEAAAPAAEGKAV